MRGLKCPLPALKTRKALVGLLPGDIIVVERTDPSAIDIPALLNETQDVLEAQGKQDGVLVFRIRKTDGRIKRPGLKPGLSYASRKLTPSCDPICSRRVLIPPRALWARSA